MAKKIDPADVLKTVTTAIERLPDEEKRWVLQSAASRWTLTLHTQNPGGAGFVPGNTPGGAQNDTSQDALSNRNARSFMRAKNPATDVQRIACLAYFHHHSSEQATFKSKDLQKIHIQSWGSRFNFTRAMDNATRHSRYISTANGREKHLTTLGEDVVEALPDQTKVAEVVGSARHPRRRRKRKAKTVR